MLNEIIGNPENFLFDANTLYFWRNHLCYRIEKFADKIIISHKGKIIQEYKF